MPKNNLKNQPWADAPLAQIPSKDLRSGLDRARGFAILSLVNPPRPKLRLSAGFLYSA